MLTQRRALFSFVALCLWGAQASGAPGMQTDEGPIPNPLTNKNYYYLEYLPVGYDQAENVDQQYPLLLFLHGGGETGDTLAHLSRVRRHGPPDLIDDGHPMEFTVNGVDEAFIVISPQQKIGSGGWPGSVVVPIVEYLLAEYRVDPSRVFLTGLSMGGKGTWQTASSTQNLDAGNYFAALAPIAGGGVQQGQGTTTAALGVPVWVFCGDGDPSVGLFGCSRPFNEMVDAGADPAPLLNTDAVSSHAQTWQRAYRTDNSLQTPNLYEWLLGARESDFLFGDGFESILPTAAQNASVGE